MKKYYDAMYRAFNYYHHLLYRNKDIRRSMKCSWTDNLFAELNGILDVACLDDEVTAGSDFNNLLNLRSNLCSVARIYSLKE